MRIILLCLPSILLASTVNGEYCFFSSHLSFFFFLCYNFLTHFQTFHASNEHCAFQFCSKSTQNFVLIFSLAFHSFRGVFFSFVSYIYFFYSLFSIYITSLSQIPFFLCSHLKKSIIAVAVCIFLSFGPLLSVSRKQSFLTSEFRCVSPQLKWNALNSWNLR